MHSQVLGCLAGVISSCFPFKAKFILFNKIFKNGIYIKAQVQIIQNIQIWLPMKNIVLTKKKDHIQENAKGKNLKEGHMIRNRSNFIDCYSTFFALSCVKDKLMLGQRGLDTVLLRRRKTDNHTY